MSHQVADEKFMKREQKKQTINCMWEWEKFNCPTDAEKELF